MKNKIICIVFLLLVFGFCAFDVFTPVKERSEWENKKLAQRPTLTVSSLLKGEYGKDYESFITDQFVMRDRLVRARYIAELGLGKKDVGGIYVGGNALYSVQSQPDYENIDKSIAAMEKFTDKLNASQDEKITPYLMVVPSSTYICRDQLPAFAPVVDEKEIFDYISKRSDKFDFIDITDKMYESRTDYIYFHTDHHWTGDGALIGYNAFLEAMGREPVSKDSFTVSTLTDSFLGTHCSKSGAVGIDPDTMERLDRGEVTSFEVYDGKESQVYDSMYFEEYLEKKDKYSYYLGENKPLVRIKTESEGGRILVFKDSYAHIMAPMMIEDFSEIVMVDLRHVSQPVGDLLDQKLGADIKDFDTVLFLYSADTFTTQYEMVWIK